MAAVEGEAFGSVLAEDGEARAVREEGINEATLRAQSQPEELPLPTAGEAEPVAFLTFDMLEEMAGPRTPTAPEDELASQQHLPTSEQEQHKDQALRQDSKRGPEQGRGGTPNVESTWQPQWSPPIQQRKDAQESRKEAEPGTIGSARSASSRMRWADTEEYTSEELVSFGGAALEAERPKEHVYFLGGPPRVASASAPREKQPPAGEGFFQARTTRIRPTGCYVRLRGGDEAFLGVEHMDPFTEASTVAIKERFPQPGRVFVRDLGDGTVTMLSKSDAEARAGEMEARRCQIEAEIAFLRDTYDPRQWLSGQVSAVQPHGILVSVVEGKDAFVALREMPDSVLLAGSDSPTTLRVGDKADFRVVRYRSDTDSFLASMLSFEDSVAKSRAARGLPPAQPVPPAARSASRDPPGGRGGEGGERRGRASTGSVGDGGKPDRLQSTPPSAGHSASSGGQQGRPRSTPPATGQSEQLKVATFASPTLGLKTGGTSAGAGGGGKPDRLQTAGSSSTASSAYWKGHERLRPTPPAAGQTKQPKGAAKGGSSQLAPQTADRVFIVNAVRGMSSKVIGQLTMPRKASENEIKDAAADMALKNGDLKPGQDHKGITISKNLIHVKV